MTQLISDVRAIADVESESDRHPDATIQRWLNEAIAAYREELSDLGTLAFLKDTGALSLVSGTSDYTLPEDCQKLYGVTIEGSNSLTWEAYPAELQERHDYTSQTIVVTANPTTYLLVPEGKIRFLPTPQQGLRYRLLYLPTWTDITGSTAFDPLVSDGDRWVVLEAALQVATKDNRPEFALLAQRRAEVWARVKKAATSRRSGPARRLDTYSRRRNPVRRLSWT